MAGITVSLRPKQLRVLLAKAFAACEPVLITGAPGIGKSSIIEQAAADAKMDLILSHPVTSDPTDAKGLPWKVEGRDAATFLPFGDLERAVNATRPTVWFLDDLGQATPAVQASFMQLILARCVNGHKLPDCVTFAAATNRRTDRAGVTGILEPVKSRFVTIVELVTHINDFCEWWFENDERPAITAAFLQFRPDLLCQFNASADMTNSPIPRTWAAVGRLENLDLPVDILSAAVAGAVGPAAAVEYMGFRRMADTLTSLDGILINPSTTPIPSKPDVLFATAVGLAAKATTKNFGAITTYCDRVAQAGKGEFAVLCVKDATRRKPELLNTNAFIKLNGGPVGKLLTGQD